MSLAVDSPIILFALILMILPLVNSGMRLTPNPSMAMLPADLVSTLVTLLLRGVAMVAIAGLIFGMAGLHQTGQSIERIGNGAHIVILLDRSNSMDNSFAGKTPNGLDESKSSAARRLLAEFVVQRKTDLIGVAEYSTTPLFIIPLTENKQAVQAAIAATATPALAYTHVSKGLGMALSFFQEQALTGSRVVLLVSDGAAVIDPDSEQALREWFKQQQVRLYWVFLRTANSPGILAKPTDSRDDNAQAMPELYLHKFFSTLGIPYKAYEAESPNAMKDAINEINQLENLPVIYQESLPKQDLSGVCYAWAAFLIVLLLGFKFCEVKLTR
jgi:mxaC protein